jgi:hypothetical protein
MSGEVKLIRGNDRIRQLAGRPDITDDIAQIRAAMAEADRAYAMRLVTEFTQAESSEGGRASNLPVSPLARWARDVPQVRGHARLTRSTRAWHPRTASIPLPTWIDAS